jgi:hypothetical protein
MDTGMTTKTINMDKLYARFLDKCLRFLDTCLRFLDQCLRFLTNSVETQCIASLLSHSRGEILTGLRSEAILLPPDRSSMRIPVFDHKQTDWGCWVIKLKKSDIIVYLDNDKYRKYEFEVKCLNYLLEFAHTLNDTDEYLLVALEWG